jgi:hypothetical protein
MPTLVSRRTYQYSPLNSTIRSIRLVEILPVTNAIEIRLHEYPLDEAPPFEALTYSLQASDNFSSLVGIRCGGLPFDLRVEICSFLQLQRNNRIARGKSHCPLVWIDAISIDMKDQEETKYSRSFMNAVYARATRTIGWLGISQVANFGSLEMTMSAVVDSMRDFISFSDADPAQVGIKVTHQLLHIFQMATKDLSREFWQKIDELLEQRFFTR